MRRAARPGLGGLALVVALGAAGCASQRSAGAPDARPAVATTATTPRPDGSGADRVERATPAPVATDSPQPKPQPEVAPVPPPVPDPSPADIESTAATGVSPGAPSDAEVRKELATALHLGAGASSRRLEEAAGLTAEGLAVAPPAAPAAVEAVIRGGNRVAHAPYVYGGGHGTFTDSAYDCSGSVSFALASAGLLGRPLDSSSLEHWGRPRPGRWITVYANAGHAFMTVAGLRFDTSGRSGDHGSRWQAIERTGGGFVARHPPGL